MRTRTRQTEQTEQTENVPGIQIRFLLDDAKGKYDTGTDSVDSDKVCRHITERLRGKSFKEPNWSHALKAEKLNPEVKVNDKILYAGRTSRKARAIYVTHESSGKEYMIVVAVVPDHKYDNCPAVLNSSPTLAADIANVINVLETPKAPEVPQAAGPDHPTPTEHPEKRAIQLTASQDSILKRMGEHVSGLVMAPGGVGKTILLIEWLKTKILSGQIARCFVTTQEVKALILAGLGPLSDNPLLVLQTWDEFRTEQEMRFPERLPSTEGKKPLRYFEESENTAEKAPCFLTFFEEKCPHQKKTSGKRKKQTDIDPEILWAEVTRVIFQLSDPYSVDAYQALGERESHYKKERREEIYDIFSSYLRYARNVTTHYEQHEREHALSCAMQSSPDRLPVNAIAIDEVQAAPLNLMQAAMTLALPHQTQLLFVGDTKQDTGLAIRTKEPIEKVIAQYATYETFQLTTNLRSAKKPIACANALLFLQNTLIGSKERHTTFYLNDSAAMKEGAFFYMPDIAPRFPTHVNNDARFAVLVPDETTDSELDNLKTTWGNNVFRISNTRGLEWDHVIITGFSDELLKPLSDAVSAHSTLRRGFSPLSEEPIYARKQSDEHPEKSAQLEKVLSQLYTAVTRTKENIYFCGMDSTVFQNMSQHLYPSNSVAAEDRNEAVEEIFRRSTPREWFVLASDYINKGKIKEGFDIIWSDKIWGTAAHAASAKKSSVGFIKAEMIIPQVDLALSSDNPIQSFQAFVAGTKKPAKEAENCKKAATKNNIETIETSKTPETPEKPVTISSTTSRSLTLFSPAPVMQLPVAIAATPAAQSSKSNLTEIQRNALKKVEIELKRKNPTASAAKAALLNHEIWGNHSELLACIESLLFPEEHNKTMKYCEEMLVFARKILEKDIISIITFYTLRKKISSEKERKQTASFAEKIRKEFCDIEAMKATCKKLFEKFRALLIKNIDEELKQYRDTLTLVIQLYDKAATQAVFFPKNTKATNHPLYLLFENLLSFTKEKSHLVMSLIKDILQIAPEPLSIDVTVRITLTTMVLRYSDANPIMSAQLLQTHPVFTITDDFFSTDSSMQYALLSATTSVFFQQLTSSGHVNYTEMLFSLIQEIHPDILELVFLDDNATSALNLRSIFTDHLKKIHEHYQRMTSTPNYHAKSEKEATLLLITKNSIIFSVLSQIIAHTKESTHKNDFLTILSNDFIPLMQQLQLGTIDDSNIFSAYRDSLKSLCTACKKSGVLLEAQSTFENWVGLFFHEKTCEITDKLSCLLLIADIMTDFTSAFLRHLREHPSRLYLFSMMLESILTSKNSVLLEDLNQSSDTPPMICRLFFTAAESANENAPMQLLIMAMILSSFCEAIMQAKKNNDHVNFEQWVKNLIAFYNCLPPHLTQKVAMANHAMSQQNFFALVSESFPLSEKEAHLHDGVATVSHYFVGLEFADLLRMTFDDLFTYSPHTIYYLSHLLTIIATPNSDQEESMTTVSALVSDPQMRSHIDQFTIMITIDPNGAQLLFQALQNMHRVTSRATPLFQQISSLMDVYTQNIEAILKMVTIPRETSEMVTIETKTLSPVSAIHSGSLFQSVATTSSAATNAGFENELERVTPQSAL